jgi:UDP-glucose:(heptosyl)LPS alpha-1,3-glucosyltransferase
MKVALVCERFDPNAGGLEQWTWQFVQRLGGRGHDVHVVTFQPPIEAAPSTIHVLPWHRNRLKRARAVEAALPQIGANIVHDLGVGWACDILHPQAGSKLANHRRELHSQTYRERSARKLAPGYWRWLLELRALERRQYARCCTLIAVSGMVARDMHELHGAPPEHIRVIPNGVDTERFSPQCRAVLRDGWRRRLHLKGETLFLFAAHNPRLKGLRPLLNAMGELRLTKCNARLAIIGCDPPDYRREAAELGLEDSVIFAGFVEDTLPYFAAADAFVLPTYYDACSLSVIEAAACGLPVITTRYNGAAELLTHERGAFILGEPDNHHALAAAMARLTDSDLRDRMSTAARMVAVECGMDANVSHIEEVYGEEILRREEVTHDCR